MAPSNVEVTVFILDIGLSVSTKDKDEIISFFEKARNCMMRIIERKIFSRPYDLVGVILMGSKQTNNDLAVGKNSYQNISVAASLTTPSWDLVEMLRDEIKPSENDADWLDAIVVAADFLQKELGSKKVSSKKIVLMTDLKTCPNVVDDELDIVIEKCKRAEFQLIAIGPDIWMDDNDAILSLSKSKQQQQSEEILKKMIAEDGIACSFEETIYQLMFHKKKVTNPSPWNVDLKIGPDIYIPISGYGKIRDNQTVGQWKKSFKNTTKAEQGAEDAIVRQKTYFKTRDNTANVDELDIVQGYLYGKTIVPFNKFDKEMEYKSGPRGLSVIGFTKNVNINWNNLTGDGITYIVARKTDEKAKIALDAFVTELNNLKYVAIARKVYNNNNAPHMNVLFPMIENDCKYLSMIALAFKEDYRNMLFPSINQKKFAYNDEQAKAIDDLIDSMNLNDPNEDKEYFSVENSVNPTIQHTFDTITHRALDPKGALPQPRPEVQELLQVPSSISKLATEPLELIKNNFQLSIVEKPRSGKRWTDQNLMDVVKDEGENESKSGITDIAPPTALSVMASQVTRVGTVDPAKDFMELLNNDAPIDKVSEEMIIVIENLVFLTVQSNFTKPLSAIKALRLECVNSSPQKYNNWLSNFKNSLLERSRNDFFEILIEEKLGLIARDENPSSEINDTEAALFYSMPSYNTSMDIDEKDNDVIDDLFD